MKYIADISHHRKVTDWGVLKDAPFIISKATEGTTFIDSTLNDFIRGCEQNHIPYFLYTFMRNGKELAGTKFMVETCKGKVGKYFRGYALDIETGGDGKTPNVEGVKASMDYLESLGMHYMIYTMYAQYTKYKNVITSRTNNCAWWEARYGANNGIDTSAKYPCHVGVDLHQFTSKGVYKGIATGSGIDLNRLTGTKPLEWFVGGKNMGICPYAEPQSNVKKGSVGDDVKWVQWMLNHKLSSNLVVDGIAGSKTDKAIREYQAVCGLAVDGIVGKNTRARLKA